MGGEEICESNELYKFLWLILSKATLSTICIINIPDGQTGRHLTPEKNHTKKTLLTSSCCLLWIPPQFRGGNTAPWKCAGNSERCLSAPCIHFIFRLLKDCNIGCWTWTLTSGSHSGWLILDEACVAPGLSRECYDLPSKERGKWKHSLVVSSPLGDNSFFSCSWQKEEAGPPLPFWFCFFFRENRSAFILLGVSLSHLDVTITRMCQEWITVPFSTLVTAGGFCVSLKTKPPKCSRLENPFFGIYILPTPG